LTYNFKLNAHYQSNQLWLSKDLFACFAISILTTLNEDVVFVASFG